MLEVEPNLTSKNILKKIKPNRKMLIQMNEEGIQIFDSFKVKKHLIDIEYSF
jgi:hypothetical protein